MTPKSPLPVVLDATLVEKACAGDRAAIDAVLHHATGPYLYFVTIDQAGHTAFATTLDQFNQLVAESRANGVQ